MIKIEYGYYIDKLGNVYNRNKRKMTPQNHTGGYDKVSLWDKQTRTKQNRYIHRLVAINFIENPNNYKYVNHINGNKKDNRVKNLEWCSAKHNTNHAIKNGLIKTGENSTSSKLTNKQVTDIRNSYVKGKITYEQLGKKYGVSKSQIERIVNKKRWKQL